MATQKRIPLSEYYVKQEGWAEDKNVITNSNGKISTDNIPSIPTDTSDLTNGANFTTATGHNHDNRYYTETEIDNKLLEKADTSAVDDIVAGDVELTNYYTKAEINTKVNEKANLIHNHDDKYYTETEIDTKIQTINNNITNAISNLELIEIVQDLPTTNIKTNKLYLKTNGNTTNENKYDIYIRTINNEWEKIDSLDFTITDYIKKTNNNTDLLLANGEKIPQSTFLTTHNPIDSSLNENSTNAVQNKVINTELNKKENTSNKVLSTSSLTSSSTDTQYPSAKLVYNNLDEINTSLDKAEYTARKIQSISSFPTSESKYPSAKAVYDYAQPKGDYLTKTNNNNIILGNGQSTPQSTFALAHDHPYLSSGEGSVTSYNIVNKTIVNDDISDTANIAFSKLNGVAASGHDHNGVYLTTENGAVGTNNLADNAVTNDKIATDAINSNNIINGTITNEDISSDTKISYSKLNGVAASDHEHNKWKLVYRKQRTLAETNNNYNYTIKISVNPELLLANFDMKCTDWKGDNSGTNHTFVDADSDFLDESLIPKQDIVRVLNLTGTEIFSFSGASASSNWRGRIVANSPSKAFPGFSVQILYKPNGNFTSLDELEEITEY